MRILFLTSRFPYPPLRGDQVRAYHQIRLLAVRHEVTLVAVSDRAIAPDALTHMQARCREVVILPLSIDRALAGLGRVLLGDPRPLQVLLYLGAGRGHVAQMLAGGAFDLVHAQLVRTTGLLPPDCPVPVVVDLVDTLSASYRGQGHVAAFWRRAALEREAERLLWYERDLLRRGWECLVVSEAERRALETHGGSGCVTVNPNGVDADRFAFRDGGGSGEGVVFVGNLGYAPNADGISWFVRDVWPAVRARRPRAALRIVGPRAPRGVRALGRRPGVTLAGVVESVHEELTGAAVAVAPLRTGAGIQNKVLEAMASGTPVVATPRAVNGIAGCGTEHCAVAESPTDFGDAVVTLLGDVERRRALAGAARRLVCERYTWEHSIATLEGLYEVACRYGTGRALGSLDSPGAFR
jgi:sugar transferase (PEP-CTERM/EpsH1 system associated)